MHNYKVTLTGSTPLLMHHDNIEWADFMEDWKNNPENKAKSKAGDDRTPAWRWLGCLYHDNKYLVLPSANIMRAIMEGGAMVPVPGGRSGKTFKSQTQSGMMSVDQNWLLRIDGKPIEYAPIAELANQNNFATHKQICNQLGFDLMVKRAKIGTSKHIRVRPVFPVGWTLEGNLSVWDEQITAANLAKILDYAGQYKGLGDWRPGGKTPGPYGMFEAVIN